MRRRERQLRWVTVDGQSYPREKAADWLDAVRKGLCPFCGAGPFTVVAGHVAQRHNLNRSEFRDALGLPVGESICDPVHSQVMRLNGQRVAAALDMKVVGSLHGGPRRRTVADQQARAALRRPLPCCVVCGKTTPARSRRTCSDECRVVAQSISAKEVRARDVRAVEMLRFFCPECGQEAEKPASQVRSNRRQGWDGPFCGMSCAAKYRQRKRYS